MPSTRPSDCAPAFRTEVKKAGKIENTISDEKSLKRLVSPRKKIFLGSPNILLVVPTGVVKAISLRVMFVPRSGYGRQPPRYITHVRPNVGESLRRASDLITWWLGQKAGTTFRGVPVVIDEM